jgi:hypothetical protein
MTLAMTGSGGHELGGNGRTGPTAVAPGSLWMKALGRHVGLPVFVLDAEGNLAYFNETAAALLGRSYTEIGPLPPEEWGALWTPTTVEGTPDPGRPATGHGGIAGTPTHARVVAHRGPRWRAQTGRGNRLSP